MYIKRFSIVAALVLVLIFSINPAISDSESDINITRTLEVGSSEEAKFISSLYKKYPNSRLQLDKYRKEVSGLDYGTEVNFHFMVQSDTSDINWSEVTAGAGVGLGLALFWNAFGGEILCAIGFAPMCVCVGPQC